MPAPLIMQYEVLTDILDKAGVKQLSVPSFEADDVIGTVQTYGVQMSLETAIFIAMTETYSNY